MAPTYSFEQVISFTEDKELDVTQMSALIDVVKSEKEHYSQKEYYIIEMAFYVKARNILERERI